MNLTDKKGLSNHLNLSVGKIDNLMKNKQINYYKIGKNVRFNLNNLKVNMNLDIFVSTF